MRANEVTDYMEMLSLGQLHILTQRGCEAHTDVCKPNQMKAQRGEGSGTRSSTLAEDLLTVLNCCKKWGQLSLKRCSTHPRFGQHKLDRTWGGRTQSWVGREVGMNPGRFGEGE